MYSLHERDVLGLRKARPIHPLLPSVMVMLSAWPYRARPARSSPAARTLLCELRKRPRRICNHAVSACCHVISLPRATTDAARSPTRTAPLGTYSMHITACIELASPSARSGPCGQHVARLFFICQRIAHRTPLSTSLCGSRVYRMKVLVLFAILALSLPGMLALGPVVHLHSPPLPCSRLCRRR